MNEKINVFWVNDELVIAENEYEAKLFLENYHGFKFNEDELCIESEDIESEIYYEEGSDQLIKIKDVIKELYKGENIIIAYRI